jgi:hypothetical protein
MIRQLFPSLMITISGQSFESASSIVKLTFFTDLETISLLLAVYLLALLENTFSSLKIQAALAMRPASHPQPQSERSFSESK